MARAASLGVCIAPKKARIKGTIRGNGKQNLQFEVTYLTLRIIIIDTQCQEDRNLPPVSPPIGHRVTPP